MYDEKSGTSRRGGNERRCPTTALGSIEYVQGTDTLAYHHVRVSNISHRTKGR